MVGVSSVLVYPFLFLWNGRLCGEVVRGDGVLKGESGEEGNSSSVSWASKVFRADACAGTRQKEWSRIFSVLFVSYSHVDKHSLFPFFCC